MDEYLLFFLQFAYNEMSFMLIRLLQSFSSIILDPASAPPGSLPPPEWKRFDGRKAIEQVMPKVHLTMHASVRRVPRFICLVNLTRYSPRAACGSRWRKAPIDSLHSESLCICINVLLDKYYYYYYRKLQYIICSWKTRVHYWRPKRTSPGNTDDMSESTHRFENDSRSLALHCLPVTP